jgi:hypothetical protein
MDKIVSYCGLDCQTCPIYLATRIENKDKQVKARAELAQICKEQYGMSYTPEDITDCDGCQTNAGRLFSACSGCPIRNCASQKGIRNCAYCTEYACEKLDVFFRTDPMAKTRLDGIKRNIT